MLLLDTHVLLWLVRGELKREEALDAIAAAQNFGTLCVSAITAWELGTAERKRINRPELGMEVKAWFQQALQDTGATLANITPAIAAEAASVPANYGRGDPGDCFLIATARVRRLSLATRDTAILDLAERRPDDLRVVKC